MILQSERHRPEFGRDTSYLPEAWLNRKNLCIFFLKKPGQISLSLLCLKQPLWWSEHTAQLPVWLSPLLCGLAGLLGKATPPKGNALGILHPALVHPLQVPGLTASRPPRYTDKLGFSLQDPDSIPHWCQQLAVFITLWIPSEEASYLLDFLCSSRLYLGISAKDMFWLDPLLWPLNISGKLSYKKHSPGGRKRKEGFACLNAGPYKRNVLQGPGACWTSDQHLPKIILLLLSCFSRVRPCATP